MQNLRVLVVIKLWRQTEDECFLHPSKCNPVQELIKRVLPTRFSSFPVFKTIYFFYHQSKISQRKKMLMAGLENKQHGLCFQQSILIVERTVCLLFCDQCLFWCVKSDKTRNGRGSLPCQSVRACFYWRSKTRFFPLNAFTAWTYIHEFQLFQ